MDRNHSACQKKIGRLLSLSARRAWIEIAVLDLIPLTEPVALRKESVDRNCRARTYPPSRYGSLSARRAWIEIPAGCWRDARRAVALRKESVDRNVNLRVLDGSKSCRSPQGERG